MATPLPLTLRARILAASERPDMTIEKTAALFSVGTATVKRLRRLHRASGTLAPRPKQNGRQSKLTPEALEVLRGLVEKHPDAFGHELASMWTEAVEVAMTRSDVVRGLKRLGMTRKKSR